MHVLLCLAIESRLGSLNVFDKTAISGIYFYVQRQGNLPVVARDSGVIRFNKERLNVGKAMNMSSGVFTAPKPGIYHFSFSILKEGFTFESIWIYFRVNGVKMGMSAAGNGLFAAPTTIQPTLKLRKGDRVDLWKSTDSGTLEYRSGELTHHFSGWLLSSEEDLE